MNRKPVTYFCLMLALMLGGVGTGSLRVHAGTGGVDSTASRYMNDWYQFNQNYIKLLVSQDGAYRVTLADLSNAGVQNLATLNPDRLQVIYRGEEIPIAVTKNGGSLNYFEFWGRKNDGGIDSLMYRRAYTPFAYDPEQQPNRHTSFFSDTSAYFVTWDANALHRYASNTANNFSDHTALPWYRYRAFTEYALNYFEGGGGSSEVAHILNPDYITGEGFLGKTYKTGDLIDAMADYIATPGFANSGNPTKVAARVVSITSSNQHITAIDLLAQDRYADTTFGINIKTHEFDFNEPLPPSTLIRFRAYGTGSKPDMQRVAWHYLEYDRSFNLDNATSTVIREFNHPDTTHLRFYNADYSSTAYLMDPTTKLRIQATVDNDTLRFLVPGSPIQRTLYMYTDNGIGKPIVQPRTDLSNLSSVNNGAEYVIITHPRFANSAQAYARYRDTCTVNPIGSVKIVYVNQIMDEFAYGSFTSWGIKNFCKYAIENWTTKPKYFLLWGKGRKNHKTSASVDYVPSFGYPANDYEFVSYFERDAVNFEPMAGIGRVSIFEDSEGLAYLNKVNEYEHQEYDGWMKRALMLGGGKTPSEQGRIRNALVTNYISKIEQAPVGAEAYYFQKEGNGIESNTERTSEAIINDGVGIIHFFGHSGTNIFDVDIQEANRYTNYGRTPFMVAFGCYGGDFLENGQSFGERFILEPNRGSIGYLANSTAGFLQQLYDYGNLFYDNATGPQYQQPIGDVIRATIKNYADSFNGYSNVLVANHCKQVNLQGDPMIVIRFPEKPDLSVTDSDVFFTPEVLTAQEDNYVINVVSHNEGRVFQDSFRLQIKHRAPTGEEVTYEQVQYGPFPLRDTLRFPVENLFGNKLAGLNRYEIFLDALDSLREYSETNNKTTVNSLIQGNLPAILFPYEYAIVDKPSIFLSASTQTMTAVGDLNYIFEIDTVSTFTSPFKTVSGPVQGTSPYCKWDLPFDLREGQVYYWRVRLAQVYPLLWNTSSFKYVNGKTGWSQSKAAQFVKDPTSQINFDETQRDWQFDQFSRELHAYISSIQVSAGAPIYFLGPYGSDGQTPSGLVYTSIDQHSLIPHIQNTDKGDWRFLPAPAANDASSVDDLVAAISATETGDYFLVSSAGVDGRFGYWSELQKRSLEMIGVRYEEIKDLPNGNYFIFFGRKGAPPGSATTILSPNLSLGNQNPRFDLLTDLTSNFGDGKISSTLIGPTENWEELIFDWTGRDAFDGDSMEVDIAGIRLNNTEANPLVNLEKGQFPLTSVDPEDFPYMRLDADPRDDANRSAPQLDIWEVYYTPVPDVLADPSVRISAPDTIEEGEIAEVFLTARNSSDYDMDSLLVRYELQRGDRSRVLLGEQRYGPLPANSTIDLAYRFHSANKNLQEGDVTLVIELNPANDQLEQYQFNNFYFHPMYVKLDHIGPILDVTVDGKHIMDGDIIAPDPEIVVELNDENAFLPVSISDSTYRIWFGTERTYTLNEQLTISGNAKIESVPGRLPENRAKLSFRPGQLPDGEYTLAVQGYDFKGNQAGGDVYMIHFNVVNEKAISDVLPYPNPFSTATRFVYTLTGGERPYVFDIEIYTITGRLVKTVDLLAEGDVHFGYNITEYTWDGTDEYGDLLANGVYIYKVKAKFEDRFGVKKRDEGLPENIMKNDFGKMYIMR